MSVTTSESLSPLGESQAASRRKRLYYLARMVFDLMLQGSQGGAHPKYDGVEDPALINALRVCGYYVDEIGCFDSGDRFVVELQGTDGHSYVVLFSLFGPGLSIQASRVRITNLPVVEREGQVDNSNDIKDVLEEFTKRLKFGRITTDRAFLIGMSLVIGFMDDQDDDPDEDARLEPLSALIRPTDDELREIRASLPPSSNYEDEVTSPLPEGTKVPVEPTELERDLDALRDLLLSVAGKAQGLPPDLAAQHDHYLHGQPKR